MLDLLEQIRFRIFIFEEEFLFEGIVTVALNLLNKVAQTPVTQIVQVCVDTRFHVKSEELGLEMFDGLEGCRVEEVQIFDAIFVISHRIQKVCLIVDEFGGVSRIFESL